MGWVLILFLMAAAGGVGFWIGHRSAGEKDADEAGGKDAEPKPVASVEVVPIRKATITDDVIAYGSITAPTSEVRVVSVPFESRVTKITVSPGQSVEKGTPLIEVVASAGTALAMEDARNALAAAQRDFQLVQQRFEQKLATTTELNTAQSALTLAQAHFKSLEQAGVGGPRQLTADANGIVGKIDVQSGQVVPIGAPLVEVAVQNEIEAKLGVEPDDAAALKVQQPVGLRPVDNAESEPVVGKIRLIGRRVDPASRLVDVMVTLPQDSKLILESFVSGKTSRAAAEGLLVPRDAVLPSEEAAYELFTIKDGKAVKHSVKIGVENDQQVQVIADDLNEGDLVVVVGNYELENGMQVNARPAATSQPAAAERATTQASAPEGKNVSEAESVATHSSTQTGGAR
jgi:RND family efflux transporter MFP subunit